MNRTTVLQWLRGLALFGLVILEAAGFCFAQNSDFKYIANPPRVRVVGALPQGFVEHRGAAVASPVCKTSIGPLICYTPAFLRAAYNYPSALDGSGQTIVIVDAFGSPTIASDLSTFDSAFGIPDPPSFKIFCPAGCPPLTSNRGPHDVTGWSIETSLDVEYAHAMAPGADIVLFVAPTNAGNVLNLVESAAIKRYPGSIMSQSFGIPEYLIHGNNAQLMQAEKNYEAAAAAGITVLASTGDFGATNGLPIDLPSAQFPSSDPLVTAVGGTEGLPYPGGLVGCDFTTCTFTYGGEQVWNEPRFGAATGGAPSLLFSVPTYQQNLGLTSRTTPDVAYNAAIDGGVLVLDSALGGFFIVGGTSAGSPQWAAIFALANEAAGHSLGFVNPAVYSLAESSSYASGFHDITIGNNQLVGTPVGFSATTGYDFATGWGTPNVTNFVSDLVAAISH